MFEIFIPKLRCRAGNACFVDLIRGRRTVAFESNAVEEISLRTAYAFSLGEIEMSVKRAAFAS